jgi:hypothetical protein
MQGASYTVVLMTRRILIYRYITGFITIEDASKQRGSCDNYIYVFWYLHYLVSVWYKPLLAQGGLNIFPGHAIAQAVSRRPIAIRRSVLVGFLVNKVALGQGFL